MKHGTQEGRTWKGQQVAISKNCYTRPSSFRTHRCRLACDDTRVQNLVCKSKKIKEPGVCRARPEEETTRATSCWMKMKRTSTCQGGKQPRASASRRPASPYKEEACDRPTVRAVVVESIPPPSCRWLVRRLWLMLPGEVRPCVRAAISSAGVLCGARDMDRGRLPLQS
ncbi:hypothetical protein BS78_04G077700 [Paspalum vaginatum]|nr:hypothetical protein BS78_04G077700 [Paspalum vaginatum]